MYQKQNHNNHPFFLFLFALFTALLCLQLGGTRVFAQTSEGKNIPWTVEIIFGIRGPKPLIWSGKASINKGRIDGLQGINFGPKDRLLPEKKEWKCSIDRLRGNEIRDQLQGLSPREYLEERISKGITFDLHAPENTRVSITTAGGVFSFDLADLEFGKPLNRLEGNVRVRLAPRSFVFGSKKEHNNYSAVAIDKSNKVWCSFINYRKGKEKLILRQYAEQKWGKQIEAAGKGTYLKPSLTADDLGGLWVCWAAKVKDNWDIYARYRKAGKWEKTFRLSDHPAPDTNQQIFIDKNNRLWVCWQSYQEGNGDIFLKYYENGQWSSPVQISNHPGNDWQPSIAGNNNGSIYLAWDTFRNKEHSIILRQYTNSRLLPEIVVASYLKNYVAHVDLAADDQGRLWIAWDISGEDWGFGEDQEERFIEVDKNEAIETQINYLKVPIEGRRGRYNSRKIGLLCYVNGKFYTPIENFEEKFGATMKIYADLPQLEIDSSGRVWLFFHHYVGKIPFYIHDKKMEIWKVYGMYYNGRNWSSPIEFPHTTWRNIYASSVCTNKNEGDIWVTFAGDQRKNGSRKLELPSVCVASLNMPKIAPRHMELIPYKDQPKVFDRTIQIQTTPVDKKRYQSLLGIEKYELFWGTVHEQHDSRGRMAMDGFVVDAFKYALDDQYYDFLGITDYAYRDVSWFSSDNYALWEAKKANSIYSTKKDFLSFYLKGRSPYKRAPGHSLQKRPIPKGAPVITAVYVKDYTNDSFIEALENRRNYVATDWIILDFTIEGRSMGEKFQGINPHPRILAKIIGTDEIEQVDIIRNAKCIYSSKSIKGKEADITFVDMDLPSDKKFDYHYFIQVKQKNGGLAWTPPCCYHYTPIAVSSLSK